jgi:CheY-like chemotaxis protein
VETVSGDAAAKQIEITINTAEEVIFVDADPLRLEQVIWNLLNNAVKFTPDGGRITIRLGGERDRAILIVEDNGPGIEPEFLPHVFEMFRQADASSSRPHSGMGIGLALVRQLIGLHGGTVAVASVLGQGAKFTIELPASRETERSLRSSPPPADEMLRQMRILVVDDSEDTVDMLRRLLEMGGAIVTTARNGAEGLEIAEERDFDVVLTDISMPGMDGFEFVRRFREVTRSRHVPSGEVDVTDTSVAASIAKDATHKDVPVIALTGLGRAEDVERAAAEGFLSHVIKPIDVNSLIETLRKLPVSDRPAAAKARS